MVLPVFGRHKYSFSLLHRKEFAAIMAAHAVNAPVLSYLVVSFQQLLMFVTVLSSVLLSGPMSVKAYVTIFSLATLFSVFFWDMTRGLLRASDGYVAVTRIQVYT